MKSLKRELRCVYCEIQILKLFNSLLKAVLQYLRDMKSLKEDKSTHDIIVEEQRNEGRRNNYIDNV